MSQQSKSDGGIRIGISSCLLGEQVRFDAGHKHDRYITGTLGPFVEFVPVCPELEVGMGVPREAVRLVGDPDRPRMVGRQSETDWTDRMERYAERRVKRADLSELSGFIFKNRSPSCGLERVRVHVKPGQVVKSGVGLFARSFTKHYPDLPVEEEGRLQDASLRENFIERVFAYHRLQQLYAKPFSRGAMVDFHAAHKYLLLAHSPEYYRRLGRLVARIKDFQPAEFRTEYRALFMRALAMKATVKKNTNVLQHIAGYLKRELAAAEKAELQGAIADYHSGLVPLVVPVTLLRYFVNRHEILYIQNQHYLNPHPKELMLRNHV